jgi:Mitochondrial K+-H+ exchange-related
MLSIYLLPVGAGRFELYSEPPDESSLPPPRDGFFRRHVHRLNERWREAVHAARRREASAGRLARWRDRAVCRIAEMIAEQRTLWSLRNEGSAVLVYPSDLSESAAVERRNGMLAHARRHHGVWAILDGVLFAGSGLLALVPGPNVFAYYFGVRLVGHYLSWRGAGRGLDAVRWQTTAEPALAELGRLVDLPREARAPRVAAIAQALHLPRLTAFFDRTAIPVRPTRA